MQRLLLTLAIASFLCTSAPAQEQHVPAAAETTAVVPALNAFHTVIYKLWHTAWPAKDVAMLTSLLPAIESGADSLTAAHLPGILREKKTAWDDNVVRLRAIVQEYKQAADQKQEQQLLDAAERLHRQYERFWGILRPPMKELEAFHAELYMMYHYYLPAYDTAKIMASTAILTERAASLNKAAIPPRLASKTDAVNAARAQLSAAVDTLRTTLPSQDKEKITAAITSMHSRYEAMESACK
jgi:hypothetical protein